MSKNENIRFGIIGIGNIGTLHTGYFHEIDGAEITAICDIDPSRLEDVKPPEDFDQELENFSLTGDVSRFTDYREMYDSGLIDAVIIATPHYIHTEMTLEAFERGIHVLCEKPLAITAAEARKINRAYEEVKDEVAFEVIFQRRTSPAFKKIKEMLEDGTIGELRRVLWVETEKFRTQKYYDSGGWRGSWTGEGGGVLMNQAPHSLDLFQWLFGMPSRLMSLAYLGKWHDVTIEDDVSSLMEYENGNTAVFVTTTGDTPGTNRVEIAGNNGKLVYEKGNEGEKITFWELEESVQDIIDNSDRSFYETETKSSEIIIPDGEATLQNMTQNFVEVILNKEEPIVPGEEGIKSIELANAMVYSGLKGKKVKVPVADDKYEQLLEELREDERKNAPDKVFNWDDELNK